jgi:hypothetical protein
MAEANSKVKLFDAQNSMEHMTIFPSWLSDIIIPLSRWHPTIMQISDIIIPQIVGG